MNGIKLFNDLMEYADGKGASDVHLVPGRTAMLRIDGELTAAGQEDAAEWQDADLTEVTEQILSGDQLEEYRTKGALVCSYSFSKALRLRVSVYRQQGRDAMSVRLHPAGVPMPEKLLLPEEITELVKNCGFGVFTSAIENGGTVRGINAKGQGAMPRKKIDALVDFAKGYGAKGLAYIAIHEDGSLKSSFAKFMTDEEMQAIVTAMDGQAGDLLLFAADRNKIVWNVLGALRVELAGQMGLLDKNEYKFLWVTEFPQFEWSDEENRFVAMHHPFTMPMEEDLPLIDSDPGKVRAKAYDIVLNGNEIGGGSVRIFQDDIQEKMFEVLGFTKEQAYSQFGFLLDAFKYGVPPHAGLAYGLDRLVMLMAKQDSIRDVIAFPKVKDASCLMTEAPSVVDVKQLNELGLETTAETEK